MNSLKRILLLLILAFLGVAIPLHFWLVDRHALMRGVFDVQALMARQSVGCSDNAPEWLTTMASAGITELKALSTQLALVDTEGRLSHCETGWTSTMFLSPRVDQDTRFRFGSMTKPITAAKILSLVQQQALSLESTVGELLSLTGKDTAVASVTVGELLRHRSGIDGYMFVRKSKPACPYALTELISSGSLTARGAFRYSNLGYCLLGEVISELEGTSYRSAMESSYQLSERGIHYAEYEEAKDEVERDFRFNDFFGRNLKGRFDYMAISSTAGMTGSASAYALLMSELIAETAPKLFEHQECDNRLFKECYGYAFYEYSPNGDSVYQVKEGYLPGAAGVVVINESGEIFVWLGNSDTQNAAAGNGMKRFLKQLAGAGF